MAEKQSQRIWGLSWGRKPSRRIKNSHEANKASWLFLGVGLDGLEKQRGCFTEQAWETFRIFPLMPRMSTWTQNGTRFPPWRIGGRPRGSRSPCAWSWTGGALGHRSRPLRCRWCLRPEAIGRRPWEGYPEAFRTPTGIPSPWRCRSPRRTIWGRWSSRPWSASPQGRFPTLESKGYIPDLRPAR